MEFNQIIMGCNCYSQSQSNSNGRNYSVVDNSECAGITLDLLEMFLRPVQCYLRNGFGSNIGVTASQLQNTQHYLELYISAKRADPETCQYKEELPQVQSLINKIISAGICI